MARLGHLKRRTECRYGFLFAFCMLIDVKTSQLELTEPQAAVLPAAGLATTPMRRAPQEAVNKLYSQPSSSSALLPLEQRPLPNRKSSSSLRLETSS